MKGKQHPTSIHIVYQCFASLPSPLPCPSLQTRLKDRYIKYLGFSLAAVSTLIFPLPLSSTTTFFASNTIVADPCDFSVKRQTSAAHCVQKAQPWCLSRVFGSGRVKVMYNLRYFQTNFGFFLKIKYLFEAAESQTYSCTAVWRRPARRCVIRLQSWPSTMTFWRESSWILHLAFRRTR